MNTELRIDGIAMSLAAGQTRRRMLRLLGSVALSSGLGVAGLTPGQTAGKKKRCKRLRAKCGRDKECCGDRDNRSCAPTDLGGPRRCCIPLLGVDCRVDADCCDYSSFCKSNLKGETWCDND